MAINFNAILEDIKATNWQDAGTWHAAPKALVLIVVLVVIPVAGYFADTAGQIEALELGHAEEARLKEQYLNKKKQAINLDLHRQQLREINVQFGALLRQLPDKSQMDALLVDINQAGLGRGLQFELFKPGGDAVREFYAELPISVRVTGTYHDMGAFASDIGQLSRIVTLNDVSVSTQKDGNLTMDATARTFRYLSDDEANAQRKAAAPKPKPAAPKPAPSGGHG
jgi:type IV pilus assembly protein PilO